MAIGTSLSTKIVFLVIFISVVSIIALASISISISQQALQKDAAQRLNLIASDRIQTLKNIWNLQMEQVDSLASDMDIQSLLILHQNDGKNLSMDQNSREKELNKKIEEETFGKFLSLTKTTGSFADIQLIDDKGHLLASNNQNPVNKEQETMIALEIVKNYQEDRGYSGWISNPLYSIAYDGGLGSAVLVMIAPVFVSDPNNEPSTFGKLIGSVVVFRDIDTANSILGDKRFLGETGEAYLVDRSGRLLTDSRFDDNARYKTVVSSIPVDACFGNGSDINAAQYVSYREKLVFGTSQCERNIGIVLLSELDNAELFSPIVSLQERYTVIILGIIAAAALVALYLSNSVLRPLQLLRKIMKTVQGGTFQKADIRRSDEIGDLASSFNSMVDELEIRAKKLKLRNDILELMSSRLAFQTEQLLKADKDKEEFSAMISDELKRFVIPIIGYCELLLDGSLGEISAKQKEKVEIMLERAWSLQKLVQNILDVRRLEAGMLKMNIKPEVSVKWLLEHSLDTLRIITRSKGISVILEIDDRITLACDPTRTIQVLDNLIENAIRRTIETNKTKILVTVSLSSEMVDREVSVVFSVQDEGSEIPEQEKEDILGNKFYDLDTSFTRTSGGIDLGLIIARSIVEAHRGRMSIQSDQGKQTRFIVSMPLNQNLKKSAAA